MVWNKPPQAQLDKYHKGCTIATMFPPNTRIAKKSSFKFENLKNVTDNLLLQVSPLSQIVHAEKQCNEEREDRLKEQERKKNELKLVLHDLFVLQKNSEEKFHYSYACKSDNTKSTFFKSKCHPDFQSKFDKITVDEKKWTDICLKSVRQSETQSWFDERYVRITCSSRAHRVKTRDQENLDSLIKQFLKEKYKGRFTPDMLYGIETEPVAKEVFQNLTNCKVYDVGLVISVNQPFLACSPDGLIFINNN